ncbi:MAG: heme exporter protein CcmB [Hyphomicrobiales bacterium]
MSPALALIRRDLLLQFRQGGGAGNAIGFFLAVIVLLPIGIGPDQALLQRIAPGALWVSLLLSVLLSADRIFQADYEDGSLEAMTTGSAPLEVVTLAKAASHWLSTALPLAILAPLLGFLINLEADAVAPLLLSMAIGSLSLSLLASLGAAVTVGLRRGGLLVSLLVLPLYVPVLIFGMTAAQETLRTSSLLVLAALALAAIVLSPIGAAAALRAYLK